MFQSNETLKKQVNKFTPITIFISKGNVEGINKIHPDHEKKEAELFQLSPYLMAILV